MKTFGNTLAVQLAAAYLGTATAGATEVFRAHYEIRVASQGTDNKVRSTFETRPGERFTFEYVMLDGVNDADAHARQLARLLNRHALRAKVNLIPHNPADELPYRPSPPERVEAFKAILESKGVHAFVRRPRGQDIYAACGQLAARRDVRPAPPALYQLS